MVAVVSSNNIFARDNRAPAPAVREEDGSNYPWRMFFDNNQRIVDADGTDELLEYLIPTYSVMTLDEKKQARIDLARTAQQLARASIAADVTPEEAEKLADWEWTVLTYGEADDFAPYGWGTGSGELGVLNEEIPDEWNSSHPLVLVDIDYAPFTDALPPLSGEGDFKEVKNLIWLRTESELALLRSLSRIGYITFGSPAGVTAAEAARK